MNESEHLTEKQLTDYFDNSLERAEKREIGRHLLDCDFCLERMPKPSPAQLWAALMTDGAEDDPVCNKTILADKFEFIAGFLKQPKLLAWSAGALAVCLVFSAFIWLNAAKLSGTDWELVENFEPVPSVKGAEERVRPENPLELSSAIGKLSSDVTPRSPSPGQLIRTMPGKANRIPKTALGNESVGKTQTEPIGAPRVMRGSISAIRGGTMPRCAEPGAALSAESLTGEDVRLRWKRVPKAAKYHIYVSDDEEILIDEFESGEATEYVVKKTLDAAKIYKWKVVITLEDGRTISGDALEFTVKDVQSAQKKSNGRQKSPVRCAENN